jgi:hypothetical protein
VTRAPIVARTMVETTARSTEILFISDPQPPCRVTAGSGRHSPCTRTLESLQLARQVIRRRARCARRTKNSTLRELLRQLVSQLGRHRQASLEAIEDSKRIGSKYYQGSAWAGLALARLTSGDTAGSCQAYAEALLLMLDSGARQNVLLSLLRMSESLIDVATESAVSLSAGVAALQFGPGSDGTWQERLPTHPKSSERTDGRNDFRCRVGPRSSYDRRRDGDIGSRSS